MKRVEDTMKLVLLFFCGILILAIVIIILISLSKITLNVKKCNISNIEGKIKKKTEKEILIYVEIYLLGIIKIAKIKLTSKILRKLKIRNDIKAIEKDVSKIKSVHPIEILKRLKLREIYLNLEIGIDDVILTSYLVAVISSALGILLARLNPKQTEFKIMPLYNFGNSIKFNLNCIIDVKIVHIIYVIILLRKRRNKHERTSNRRSYDYSYE